MSVQFPQRTIQQQTDAYTQYAASTYYPYSFPIYLSLATTQFPFTSVPFSYLTYSWQADNNLAIGAIQVNALSVITALSDATQYGFLVVSYSKTFIFDPIANAGGANPIPTKPGDIGNEIFRTVWAQNTASGAGALSNINAYERFPPNNYLLKYNQFLYIHVGIDTQSLTAGNTGKLFGTVLFHTNPTGLRI